MRLISYVSAVLLLCIPFSNSHAQSYKCKMADGKTVYQGYPCPNSEKVAKPKADVDAALLTQMRSSELLTSVPFGKSVVDIVRLVPGAKVSASKSAMANGNELGAELTSYVYAGRQFHVGFYFQADKLKQVHLSEHGEMELNTTVSKAFMNVAAQLRQSYGTEVSKNLEERNSGLFGEAEWLKGSTRVSLSVLPLSQKQSSLVLNFFSQ